MQANLVGEFNLFDQIQQTFGWIDGEAGIIMSRCETIDSHLHLMRIGQSNYLRQIVIFELINNNYSADVPFQHDRKEKSYSSSQGSHTGLKTATKYLTI